jgi:hypothetical protein
VFWPLLLILYFTLALSTSRLNTISFANKVVNEGILIKFMSTQDQVANIFTKGMSSPRFLLLKSKLMVTTPPISLQGDVSVDD